MHHAVLKIRDHSITYKPLELGLPLNTEALITTPYSADYSFFFFKLWVVLWVCAGVVGVGSGAEESGVGAQAGCQCYHEYPEEALRQALQPQAV